VPAQVGGFTSSVSVISAAASQLGFFVQLEPIEMYAAPVITTYSPSGASSAWLSITGVSVTVTIDATGERKGFFILSASNVTAANEIFYIHYSADSGL
jgi:hypothetical protein